MQRAQAATPGPGEGDAEDFEQLLSGSVLAARAVHGDEGDVGPLGAQALDQIAVGFQRQHLVAEPPEGVFDPGAGAQRDPALERATAFEHGDLHAPSAFRNGNTSPPAFFDPPPPDAEPRRIHI